MLDTPVVELGLATRVTISGERFDLLQPCNSMVQVHVAYVPAREELAHRAGVVSVPSPMHSRMMFPNSSWFGNVEVKVEVEEPLSFPLAVSQAQVNLMGIPPG